MDIEKKVWEVLCSEEDLNKRVKELGEQIIKRKFRILCRLS